MWTPPVETRDKTFPLGHLVELCTPYTKKQEDVFSIQLIGFWCRHKYCLKGVCWVFSSLFACFGCQVPKCQARSCRRGISKRRGSGPQTAALAASSFHYQNPAAQDALQSTSLSRVPCRPELTWILEAFVWLSLLQDPSSLCLSFLVLVKVALKPTWDQEMGEANY